MPTVVLNDLTVAYDLVGSAPSTILMVHGHPFDRSMWRPQWSVVEGTRWRILAPDLRGYGQSGIVPGTTTFPTFAADLAALLDHLSIPDVVIGGLSMGGQIAMEFCRQYPARVRGLLLAATFPQAETESGRVARHAMADRLLYEGMVPYASEVLAKMLAPRTIAARPDLAAAVLAMMEAADPAGAAAALRGRAERPPYEPVLAALTVPALVVAGDQDPFTTREDAENMSDCLQDSELLWLDGIGHMPNLEATEAFNRALRGLLERVDARADLGRSECGGLTTP